MNEVNKLRELMMKAGGDSHAVATASFNELAIAVQEPIKEAVFPGDLYSDLFVVEDKDPNQDVRYATDLIHPGQEGDFIAYNVPAHGMVPERTVEPDFIRVPTFDVSNSIDMPRQLLRMGDYDALARAAYALSQGLTMKMNDDCFHALIAAGKGRAIMVSDAAAAASTFTKKLLTNLQTKFKRATGSNATSVNGFRLDRLYLSPELRATIALFDNTQLDEWTRNSIIRGDDGHVESMFGTQFRDIVELGDTVSLTNTKYQKYFTSTLGGSLAVSDTELVIGVDLTKRDKLVMPVTLRPKVEQDVQMARRNKIGFFVWLNYGVGVLDDRLVMLGSA